ncbi:S-layer homology domain-containing protein [Paenibacillus baimaensis]|uniref:S-layer homology domain-containing protein n=1 Tax=Paenibacillus baimaensis TaxID=2982185 RepID=UPI0038CD8DB2
METAVSSVEAEAALAKFADSKAVNVWAKQAVAATLMKQLVNGSDSGLMPLSNITRAETAVIVQRMLDAAKLINSR